MAKLRSLEAPAYPVAVHAQRGSRMARDLAKQLGAKVTAPRATVDGTAHIAVVADFTPASERWVARICRTGPTVVVVSTEHGVVVSPAFRTGTAPCAACLFRRCRATGVATAAPRAPSRAVASVALRSFSSPRPSVVYSVGPRGAEEHPLLAAPACNACSAASPGYAANWRGLPLEQSLYSRVTGISRVLIDAAPSLEASEIVGIGSLLCRTKEVLGHAGHQASSGQSVDPRAALTSALGETAERYARSWLPPGAVLDTARNLGRKALGPQSWQLFSPDQHRGGGLRFAPFTPDTPMYWIPARSLLTGEQHWVPLHFVVHDDIRLRGDTRVFYSRTTGTACHTTLHAALAHAVDEILERDALMIVWRNQLVPPSFGSRKMPAHLPTWQDFRAFDLTELAMVPTVMLSVRSGGSYFLGACTSETRERAFDKAVIELAVQIANMNDAVTPSPATAAAIKTFPDHLAYYARADRAHHVRYLHDAPAYARATPPRLQGATYLDKLIAIVRAQRADVYWLDMTPPDLRELGLVVVRALSPQLCPMEMLQRDAAYGARRLREVPKRLSWPVRDGWKRGELCELPHPF
jgi:ribosomal protein S12 methylthiotransferase accessory factor